MDECRQSIQLQACCSHSANLFKLSTTLHGWLIKHRLIILVNTVGVFIREAHTVSKHCLLPGCEFIFNYEIEETKANKQHPLWSILVWLRMLILSCFLILQKNSISAPVLSTRSLLVLPRADQLVWSQEREKPKQTNQSKDLLWGWCQLGNQERWFNI